MARDILSGFGRNAPKSFASPAECGGILPGEEVDVMRYSPPQGPKNIGDPKTPGLHGTNHGCGQQFASAGRGGRVGIGGKNRGNDPS